MAFTETVPEDAATGAVAEMYDADRKAFGYLPNLTRAFWLRPDVYAAWKQLNAAVRANMGLRRYELVTVAAAMRLRSSYCALAHGSILLDRFVSAEDLRAVAEQRETPALDAVDRAVMELASKVAGDATAVSEADVDRLRALGLTDGEVVDVVLAAAMRSFFSKVLDGLGARPDAAYGALDPAVRDALAVGRPISEAGLAS